MPGLAACCSAVCSSPRTQDSEFNVNTRYTVETVVVSGEGWSSNLGTDPHNETDQPILRRDIRRHRQ